MTNSGLKRKEESLTPPPNITPPGCYIWSLEMAPQGGCYSAFGAHVFPIKNRGCYIWGGLLQGSLKCLMLGCIFQRFCLSKASLCTNPLLPGRKGDFTLVKFWWTNFVTRNSTKFFRAVLKKEKTHQNFPAQNLYLQSVFYPPCRKVFFFF